MISLYVVSRLVDMRTRGQYSHRNRYNFNEIYSNWTRDYDNLNNKVNILRFMEILGVGMYYDANASEVEKKSSRADVANNKSVKSRALVHIRQYILE